METEKIAERQVLINQMFYKKQIIRFSNLIIEYSFYLLFLFVPLIFLPVTYELFEYNKIMLTYSFTILISTAWLIKSLVEGQFRLQKTPLDLPIFLFLVSQILSFVFSIDRHTSLFGYYSRFNGGLLSIFSYFILYYALVTHLNNEIKIKKLLSLSLFTAFTVAFWGILEHWGIDSGYWVQNVQARVFSTLGQPNWLAAYLLVFLPLPLVLFTQYFFVEKNSQLDNLKIRNLIIYYSLFLLLYSCFLFTFSVSSFSALFLALAFPSFFLLKIGLKNVRPLSILFLSLIIITIIFGKPLWLRAYNQVQTTFNINLPTITPDSSAPLSPNLPAKTTPGAPEDTGKIRSIVWKGAIDVFKSYPIFGSGVETFAYSFYKHRPAELNLTSEWDFLYNKAHNEYLNYLATTGLFGLGTYLFFIASFIFWNLKNLRSKFMLHKSFFINLALFSGWLSILITNFFGFSVVVINLFFFLIPALSFILINQEKNPDFYKITLPSLNNSSLSQKIPYFFILASCLFLLGNLTRTWLADKSFALGYNLAVNGQIGEAFIYLQEAASQNRDEPFYHSELGYITGVLASTIKDDQASLSAELVPLAIEENLLALQKSPTNLNYWKNLANTYLSLAEIDPKYNQEAKKTYQEALKLAPTDAKLHYQFSQFLISLNQKDEALEILLKTTLLKPDYREPHHRLAELYYDKGDQEKAKQEMNFVLEKIDPNDTFAREKLQEWEQNQTK